jgi:hypothetical protein
MRERRQAMKKHTTAIACMLCCLVISGAMLNSCQQQVAIEERDVLSAGAADVTNHADNADRSHVGLADDNYNNAELPSLPEGLPVAVLPQQQIPQAGLSIATVDQTANCPLPLADYCGQLSYEATDRSLIWQGETPLTLVQAAEQMLLVLATDGWVLEDSGFVDLYGDAWSCLASRQTVQQETEVFGEVLTITIMPRQKYEPISTANPMVISIVYMTTESIKD